MVKDRAHNSGFLNKISMLLLVTLMLCACGDSDTPPSETTLESAVWGTGNWNETKWQ